MSHYDYPDKPGVPDRPDALVRFDDSETPSSFAARNAARDVPPEARHLHDVLYQPDPLDTPEAPPEIPLTAGAILQDRYRIVRQLGRGGMGAVYEAVDQRLDKTLAIKETLSSEASMRRQFEREARLLAVMHHPALPKVTDHFVEGNRAFLVMEFIGGQDLARIIAQQPGPFPRDQVIAWADQLLDALIYLHTRDRQVIHRDIKPHNLKLTATGQIALLDFGLAKSQPSDPSVTASQAFFGYTRHYAPLEQIQDQHTDPRSDIYALGATLYHLLTGVKPPDAMVRAAAVVNGGRDPLRPANEIHAAVGSQIAAILNKAMAQKPEDRYTDANEFREALRRMGRTQAEQRVDEQVDEDEQQPRTDADERESAAKGSVVPVLGNEKLGSVQRSAHAVAAADVVASVPGSDMPPAYAGGSDRQIEHVVDKRAASWHSSDKRVGNSSGFDIFVEPPDMHMELVGSARRFGPAGVTVVLAMIFAIGGGILYASQRWFPSMETATEALAETPNAAALRSSAAARKQDRARVADSPVMQNTKPANAAVVNGAPVEHAAQESMSESEQNGATKSAAEKRTAAESAKSQAEKRTGAVAKPATLGNANGGQEPSRVAPRKEPRRVDAPSIRFPKVEFREPRDNRDNGDDNPTPPAREWRQHSDAASGAAGKPAANFAGKRAAAVAGKPANSGGPKFYRTADGRQIVKFPDGSTQYIRPGQRSAVNR